MISAILSVVSVIFIAVMLGIPLLIFYFNKSEKKKTKILSDKLKGYPKWIQNDVNYLKFCCVDRNYYTTMISSNYSVAEDKRFKSADFTCRNAFIKKGYFVYFTQNNNTIDCYAVKISECSEFYPFNKNYIDSDTTTIETPTKNASVVGRAVAGGLIAGGAGAVVGAISAQNKNTQNMQNPTTTTTITNHSIKRTAAIRFNCCGVKQTIGLTGVYDNDFVEKINALKNKYC